MDNKIIATQRLAPQIKKMILAAPLIAEKILPGEFIVIIIDEKGERLPLTVVDSDKKSGTITIIFQEIGKSTHKLGAMPQGQGLFGILGPLGKATAVENLGAVVTIGGGVGVAEVYPVTRSFKRLGNKVTAIVGARSKNLLILEEEMRQVSDRLLISTDDGSYGRRGFVSDLLKELLSQEKTNLVYAVGPLPLMRAVCDLTRPLKIKTLVSLNPIMVDATGMCGSCRICVGAESKFACVDGPEFDGHKVDFNELENRLKLFQRQEKIAMEMVNESKDA